MVLSMFVALGGLVLSLSGGALAGFAAQAQNNIAVYWGRHCPRQRERTADTKVDVIGQNSAGGANSQQRLGAYCASKVHVLAQGLLLISQAPRLT